MSNWREEVAEVLEVVARDGLPEPRDLDVALDAIASAVSDEIEKLRAALKEYDDAYEDWFQFAAGRKDDPNEEIKACMRLVKAQRVARAALGEKE
jgi:hypothetical protein